MSGCNCGPVVAWVVAFLKLPSIDGALADQGQLAGLPRASELLSVVQADNLVWAYDVVAIDEGQFMSGALLT